MNQKEQDLAILADAFFENLIWLDDYGYGAPGLDSKRPFGNSSVEYDILELLGKLPEGDDGEGPCWASHQRKYARELYKEQLIPYLRQRWSQFNGEAKP